MKKQLPAIILAVISIALAEVIPFKGRSYRLRHATGKPEKKAENDGQS